MKILGNRVLVSKVEEPKGEGFQTIEVQDSFVNKGKIEKLADAQSLQTGRFLVEDFNIGDIVLFAKYSPDTQEVEHEGRKMKIVRVEDILAVL